MPGAVTLRPASGDSPVARATTTIATEAMRPSSRFRRQAVTARQASTATHSMPTWNDGAPASSVATITATAASAASTAGPTSWR